MQQSCLVVVVVGVVMEVGGWGFEKLWVSGSRVQGFGLQGCSELRLLSALPTSKSRALNHIPETSNPFMPELAKTLTLNLKP